MIEWSIGITLCRWALNPPEFVSGTILNSVKVSLVLVDMLGYNVSFRLVDSRTKLSRSREPMARYDVIYLSTSPSRPELRTHPSLHPRAALGVLSRRLSPIDDFTSDLKSRLTVFHT
jgi:hypothetical protein